MLKCYACPEDCDKSALTYQDVSEVHDRKVAWEVPHLPKRHHGKPSVDDKADGATSNAEDGNLKELKALAMQDFQCKERACIEN